MSYNLLIDTLSLFLLLSFELSILFIGISFGVNILQQKISPDKIQSILSEKNGRGYLIAAMLGAITPFCSCSTIPMLRGLFNARAGFGPSLTFLFVSPLLNPIIVGLFIFTFGIKVTVVYTLIALSVSILASIILNQLRFERYVIQYETNQSQPACQANVAISSCHLMPQEVSNANKVTSNSPCCVTSLEETSLCDTLENSECNKRQYIKAKINYAVAWYDALKQFKDVVFYLLLGISLGVIVYGFIPSEFIAKYASGNNIFAVPIAAVIGLPLYVRAEAVIPLSAMLASKGMGLGAIMALIIGGSGASLTEVILLKSLFKNQMIIAFLVVILGMAVFAGYAFQFLLA